LAQDFILLPIFLVSDWKKSKKAQHGSNQW